MKKFRRSLSMRIFRKYIFTSIIFTISMVILLIGSKIFLSRYIWYGDSMMYQLFHWIDQNAMFTIIFISVVGWVLIFFYYWLKTFRYRERLIYATEELYESDELIQLPDALRKDESARRDALNRADIAFLCLPDAAAAEAVGMVDNPNTVLIDTSTAHRTAPGWVYGFP